MYKFILSLMCLTASLGGCERAPQIRQYTEITVENSMQKTALIRASVVDTPLAWVTPDGWKEEAGSGMRVATFRSEGSDPITCTIVSLGGMAGGLEANATRWASQLGLAVNNDQLSTFLASSKQLVSVGGLSMTILDFTQLQADADGTAPSMVSAIVDVNGETAFVKMTGTKSAILVNYDAFMNLSSSLRLNE